MDFPKEAAEILSEIGGNSNDETPYRAPRLVTLLYGGNKEKGAQSAP